MLVWFLVLITFCFTTFHYQVAGGDSWCMLANRRYQIGETWHPEIQPLGIMSCVNCTCLQGGKTDCKSEKCPRPNCEVPEHLPGKCCAICIDYDNLPPTDHVAEHDVTDEPLPGCDFDGDRFENGDVFPSNKTGLRRTREDQCVMCVCSMGHVLCHLKTCLPVKCKKIITTYDDCCPRCEGMVYPDELEYEDYIDSILSDPTPKNVSQADCKAMGYKENNSSWHPVVGIFGQMKCITCRCLNGKVECGRESCPPENQLPCKRPRLTPGECCKRCSKRRKGKKNKNGKRKGKGKGRKKNGHKKDKRRKKRKRKKLQASMNSTDPNALIGTHVFPCLQRNTDRFVHFMEYQDSIILAFSIGKHIEVNAWTIRKGRLSEMMVVSLSAGDFKKKYYNLKLVGATNKRRYKKMKKKLRKKLSRCKNRCRKKVVINVVKRLKTKNVTYSASCGDKL